MILFISEQRNSPSHGCVTRHEQSRRKGTATHGRWRARGDLNPGLSRAFWSHSTADSAVRLGGSASLMRLSAALSVLRPVGVDLRDCATGPADKTSGHVAI